jgi:hypothetical protein
MYYVWERLEMRTKFWSGNQKGREIGIDVREMGWKGVEWMDLAQDRDYWWALVNTVTNPPVP